MQPAPAELLFHAPQATAWGRGVSCAIDSRTPAPRNTVVELFMSKSLSQRPLRTIGVAMLKVIAVPLTLFIITGSAYAQVYKCKEDGTGKITFSDVPCHGKNSGHTVEVIPANQFDGSGLRARADQERWAEASRRAAPSGGAIGTPSASQFDSRAAACQEAKKPIPGARGQTANQRNAIMAACYGVSVPPAERAIPSPNPRGPLPASAPSPSVITNCDSIGCWDNVGGRYNKGAGNTYFPASGGGACQMIGGAMQCP